MTRQALCSRFTETQFLCIVRASSIVSLGVLFEPLQTTIDFHGRIRLDSCVATLGSGGWQPEEITKKAIRPAIFKWRQTEPELILCAVRCHLRHSLSFRDVEELLSERGLEADDTTILRWVQRYGPDSGHSILRLF